MDTSYKDFIRDVVYAFREKAAKLAHDNKNGRPTQLDEGRELAFREMLSTMKNQAEIFGLDLESVCLDGFDAFVGPLDPPMPGPDRGDT